MTVCYTILKYASLIDIAISSIISSFPPLKIVSDRILVVHLSSIFIVHLFMSQLHFGILQGSVLY